MNAAVLTKIFGRDQVWHGPCTVLNARGSGRHYSRHGQPPRRGYEQYAPRVSAAECR